MILLNKNDEENLMQTIIASGYKRYYSIKNLSNCGLSTIINLLKNCIKKDYKFPFWSPNLIGN